MKEQMILLVFLVAALAVTLGLCFLKARKQVQYKGDERWDWIQLKANIAANMANSILIGVLAVLPLLMDVQRTITVQRAIAFALLYLGLRNLLELLATIYFDKQL